MTSKLDALLDLKPIDEETNVSECNILPHDTPIRISTALTTMEKISESMPTIEGLGAKSDEELELISSKAMDAFDDLMDLAMNVEARHSSKIFEVAASMLRNSLDAKATKQANKIKLLELQLKQAKIEHETRPKVDPNSLVPTAGAAIVTDRKSLISKLKALEEN